MSKIKIFALGGLNEIGKNMYVVDVDHDLFVLDAGLKYADDRLLGIDFILPNYDYLKEHQSQIKGIFITHGHDGQMGCIPDIMKDLPNVKVYGTTFTNEIIKEQLESEQISSKNLIEIKPFKKISFGKVSVFPISVTHSVPGAVGYIINTEDGAIVYTGNFVFDPTMIGAYKTDIGKIAYIGKQGVLCLMSESLYGDKSGFTSPKHRITPIIRETLMKHEDERIIFNVAQAQLARIQEILTEVMSTERKVVIMGKRLQNMIEKAIDLKYMDFDKTRILNIHHTNDPGIIILISDEREKPFSNITRIIKGYDKFVTITDKDTVVFTNPVYDGMEKSSTKVLDQVAQIGSNLIILPTNKYLGHHASREDLMLMLNLLNPKYYFPVIGDYRHQVENAKNASNIGMKEENILLRLNGEVVSFTNGNLDETREKVKVDDILVDGKTVGDI